MAKQKAWKGESTSPGTNSLVPPDSIGRQERYSITVEDFRFDLDENNMESVEFIEHPTKTRQSGLSAKPKAFCQRCLQLEMTCASLQS